MLRAAGGVEDNDEAGDGHKWEVDVLLNNAGE